jgi:hypothetical protein
MAWDRKIVTSVVLWLAPMALSLGACSKNSQILGAGGASDGQRRNTGDQFPKEDPFAPEGEGEGGGGGGSEGGGGGEGQLYPELQFRGNGDIVCDQENPGLNDSLFSSLTKEKLTLTVDAAQVTNAGKGQNQANSEINKAIGSTDYLVDQKIGLSSSYAIFTKEITKNVQHETYVMDEALPVFVWPAQASRYSELKKKGEESFSAKVTGGGNEFRVKVTVSYEKYDEDDHEVTIKIKTDIVDDPPGSPNHRHLYGAFPLAREATYTVDVEKKNITKIHTTHWFTGEHCHNKPSEINLNYKLCAKIKDGQQTDFSCD